MAEAEALFAQPKLRRGRQQKPPLAELGEHPDSGAPVRVLDGRFGPYVTDGTVNATVPRGTDPTELTLPEAVALLRARAEMAPKKAKKAAKKADQEDREEDDEEGREEAGEEGRRRRPPATNRPPAYAGRASICAELAPRLSSA